MLLCSRHAYVLTRPPPVHQDAWITFRRPSLDARSETITVALVIIPAAGGEERVRRASAKLSCSRNAHDQNMLVPTRAIESSTAALPIFVTQRLGEGEERAPTLALCSRNARPQKGILRWSHLDQRGCSSKRGKASELGGSIQYWMEVVRGAQLVTKSSLVHPLISCSHVDTVLHVRDSQD
jgi:hypothetical protein